jgi:hypothetical protein
MRGAEISVRDMKPPKRLHRVSRPHLVERLCTSADAPSRGWESSRRLYYWHCRSSSFLAGKLEGWFHDMRVSFTNLGVSGDIFTCLSPSWSASPDSLAGSSSG